MKKRLSFVANSSSCSFIVAYKNKLNDDENTIKKLFKIEKESCMFSACKEMLSVFKEKGSEINSFKRWLASEYDIYDENDHDYHSVMNYEFVKKVKKFFDEGYIVKTGKIYNDSGDIEEFLYEHRISIQDKDLIIEMY